MNDAAMVTLSSEKPRIVVTALLGPNGGVPSEGYGGWETVDRPKRTSLTVWTGRKPLKMTLQIVLDGFIDRDTIEIRCASLERLALPPNETDPPPVVTIDCAAVPHTDLKWVVEDISWEDVERANSGRRLRQVATLALRQYVSGAKLVEYKTTKASARARAKANAGT